MMPVRELVESTQFRKDFRKISASGRYNIADFKTVIKLLICDEVLSVRYRDHSLVGPWEGFRECHIKPDWLLIYEKPEGLLVLARTGSHSELF